ncbi:MAG: hypothetical protein SWO11_00010 [Thermodesulfobacteriota bacterium]|nr:hypothetical protein [Thermodesulfobacteriota bacterium]
MNEDYNQAVRILNDLIKSNPTKAKYHHVLLLCVSKSGNKDKISKFCREIIEDFRNTEDPLFLFLCARASYIAEDYEKCAFFAKKVIAKEPNRLDCLHKLCSAYIRLGNMDESTYYYHQMARLDPNSNLTINISYAISIVVEATKTAYQGNPEAQFELFLMHLKGDIVKQDNAKALFWLQRAAENNHEKAKECLKILIGRSSGD